MLSLSWRGEREFERALVRITTQVETGSEKFVMDSIEWLVKDIRSSWFPTSPSPKRGGTPPAVDSGNLDEQVANSIGQGRNLLGQFAKGDNIKLATMSVDTSKGNGRYYHKALEEGTSKMAARPYFEPAIERLKSASVWIAKKDIVIK